MAVIRSLTLVLTNQDDLAKVWNIGGAATGVNIVKRTKVYVNESGEGLAGSENNYIGNAYHPSEPAENYIGTAAEEAFDAPKDEQAIEEIAKFNGELYGEPFLLNKLKLYTNNTDQLVEKFYYYKQSSGGVYEKKNLDLLPHYNFENLKAVIVMDREDLGGEIILDVNRRFEVKVLPHTILILDLIYEIQEAGEENEETQGLDSDLDGDEDSEEGEKSLSQQEKAKAKVDDELQKQNVKDSKNLTEADIADIRLFVRTYYKPALAYEEKAGVPALFSLSEAALLSGWSINKLGENLYLKKADSNYKGESVRIETEICMLKEIIEEKILREVIAPNKTCGDKPAYSIEGFLRAYPTPVVSIADQYKRLQQEKFKQVFALKRMPYSFVGTLIESKYSNSEQFAANIVAMMRLIEPYLLEEKRSVISKNMAAEQKQAIVLGSTGVLFFVLISLVLK